MSSKPTRLESFAVGFWIALFLLGFFLSPVVALLLLFTPLRTLMLLYFVWMFIDRNIGEKGGRTLEFSRDFFLWKHIVSYFSANSVLSSPITLDPKKNYMFTVFPHGMFSCAATIDFRSNHGNFKKYFPNHTAYSITLPLNFYIPFYRELVLAIGSCSSSKEGIEYLLRDPKGGNAIGLVPGGAAEAWYSQPGGIYKSLLKKRKGFLKLALKHGTSIVPVFSFGEIELFKVKHFDEDSAAGKFMNFLKWLTRVQFLIPEGGVAGLMPKHKRLTLVCKYQNNYNFYGSKWFFLT